jgi:hypothetical protein
MCMTMHNGLAAWVRLIGLLLLSCGVRSEDEEWEGYDGDGAVIVVHILALIGLAAIVRKCGVMCRRCFGKQLGGRVRGPTACLQKGRDAHMVFKKQE